MNFFNNQQDLYESAYKGDLEGTIYLIDIEEFDDFKGALKWAKKGLKHAAKKGILTQEWFDDYDELIYQLKDLIEWKNNRLSDKKYKFGNHY